MVRIILWQHSTVIKLNHHVAQCILLNVVSYNSFGSNSFTLKVLAITIISH